MASHKTLQALPSSQLPKFNLSSGFSVFRHYPQTYHMDRPVR